ncbi:DegT/DnrJ/EryC1/StrS family aminotransferase [Pelagicoccus mobilis]|uniref:DegT/DnrJ/EryC1/StrS family aminotransferase n=1 Tax=Pelagicoccus mobilis TaxID=415221 RepID=A0A934RZK0_9BACT|nr:DegT/DnrJ/EryC1/StrS family aminotransferase [Pelagicoccus mobilis]MBK1878219.1 DegT/DnrJ/EryC1/StrS family aminotransferase [Pelagicoccus mobilis]
MTKVPLVDLHLQHEILADDIEAAIKEVIASGAFIGTAANPFVKKFEHEFASFSQAEHCVGCANGTDAIELALRALEIGPGDEVIVPARTWVSTAESVVLVGATPVFVDSCPTDHTIDPDLIPPAITSRTKAIIPVHLYGQPARMDAICSIAKKHNLYVVEDCAQSHGATFKGKPIGTFGDAGTFSFFPGKNLGALGDAGCIITNNQSIATKTKRISDHGRSGKADHDLIGRNSRLDGIQASILSAKLKHLPEWNKTRQQIAANYISQLQDLPIDLPKIGEEASHVFHLFVIESDDRDTLRQSLSDKGIATGIHYPKPLPHLSVFDSSNEYPVASRQANRVLSLPIYPYMPDQIQQHVIESLKAAFTPSP